MSEEQTHAATSREPGSSPTVVMAVTVYLNPRMLEIMIDKIAWVGTSGPWAQDTTTTPHSHQTSCWDWEGGFKKQGNVHSSHTHGMKKTKVYICEVLIRTCCSKCKGEQHKSQWWDVLWVERGAGGTPKMNGQTLLCHYYNCTSMIVSIKNNKRVKREERVTLFWISWLLLKTI